MFSYFLPFPKVSAKNIHYCGQKVGETGYMIQFFEFRFSTLYFQNTEDFTLKI